MFQIMTCNYRCLNQLFCSGYTRLSKIIRDHVCGVMVSMLAFGVVALGFQPWSAQAKNYKIGICCFSTKQRLRSNNKDWLGIRIMCSCGVTYLPTDCYLRELAQLSVLVQYKEDISTNVTCFTMKQMKYCLFGIKQQSLTSFIFFHVFFIVDFSLTQYKLDNNINGTMTAVEIDRLVDVLGIAPFLNTLQCSRTQMPYSSAGATGWSNGE